MKKTVETVERSQGTFVCFVKSNSPTDSRQIDKFMELNDLTELLNARTGKREIWIKSGDINKLKNFPDECEFYFYTADVITMKDGMKFICGDKENISTHYFKVSCRYTHADYFRVDMMRSNGFSEEKIWNSDFESGPLKYGPGKYNVKNYPNGVVIVNQIITNPKDGIILKAKKIIDSYDKVGGSYKETGN